MEGVEGETAHIAAFFAAFCSAVRGARRERREKELLGAGAAGVTEREVFWATSSAGVEELICKPDSADREEASVGGGDEMLRVPWRARVFETVVRKEGMELERPMKSDGARCK